MIYSGGREKREGKRIRRERMTKIGLFIFYFLLFVVT